MAPPLKLIPYRCPHCGGTSQVNEAEVQRREICARELRKVGSFTCVLDDRLLCPQCRPAPAAGEVDLRKHKGHEEYRVAITHARRPVRRVIWICDMELESLKGTLRGRNDAAYLEPEAKPGKPSLASWWRDLRAEIDGAEPDLGDDLGMSPRHIEFGRLNHGAVTRPLHLLNPTGRPAVFQLTSNILTSAQAGPPRPPHFAYRIDCTPAIEAARRAYDSFEVPARSRLVIDVIAEPWANQSPVRRFEIWATPKGGQKKYIGEVTYLHRP